MPGLAILLGFNLLGMFLHALGVPLPGNVLGLLLFTLCLFLGIVKLKWVEEAAEFLLRHMLLFFAPVIVGVIVYRQRIAGEWPAMTAGVIGSLLVVLLVTGWVATLLLPKRETMKPAEVYSSPLFGVALTVMAYAISQAIYRRWRVIHPLLPTCGVLIAMLLLCHIPYESYKHGGDLIVFFLGPATVALGVPLYKQSQKIRRHVLALVSAITAGSVAGMVSAGLFVWLFHGSKSLVLSMLPKSVTTPISIAISEQLGGEPNLTAVFTVMAGLVGSVIGPALLRRVGIRHDLAIGAAMGTSSHGIGTARVIRESELQGGVSGLAMALAGIITSLLAIPVVWWLKRGPHP